jgi:hypothetical protein
MLRLSARRVLLDQPLSAENIRTTMRKIIPKRNDYVPDMELFEELLPELARFGITTRGQLKRLLTKHRRTLLADDRSRLSTVEQTHYCEWFGAEHTKNAVKRQFWFAYPAFVRNALESEFGESASVWAGSSDEESNA